MMGAVPVEVSPERGRFQHPMQTQFVVAVMVAYLQNVHGLFMHFVAEVGYRYRVS